MIRDKCHIDCTSKMGKKNAYQSLDDNHWLMSDDALDIFVVLINF